MSRYPLRAIAVAVAALLAIAVGACGSSNDNGGDVNSGAIVKGKKGGTLKVVAAGDFEHIDPGQVYYQFDYLMTYATQRPLYSFKPDQFATQSPDLAASDPKLSDGGRTVTVKLKPNIKYGPPVNRAATSKDVKYAIERAFTASVANGYVGTYFSIVKGAPEPGQKSVPNISGIETPDDQTIVFKLSEPSGAFLKALTLPVTAPVPEEYAKKYDANTPTTYGNYQVGTGPYRFQADKSGKITYQVGKSATLVRNPNWDPKTDYRPAYADQIDFSMGNEDTVVAGRQVLNGKNMLTGDISADPPVIKQALQSRKSQISFSPLGMRYVALNTTIKPLDNLNVRKAILAASDRNALRLTRGGAIVGDIATHFLTPGVPGFEEAGGFKGTGVDYLANPNGNLALAKQYLAKSGIDPSQYTLFMVGQDSGVGAKTAQVFQSQLQKLGFKVNLRQVPQDTMYSKFCNVPKADVAVCPNVGTLPDFADGQAELDAYFNGAAIVPENNNNWPQLNVPAVNKAIDSAKQVIDPNARAKAWANVDRMIVAQAPAVPWIYDKQANLISSNVQGVIDKWNADWNLSYSSIQ